MSRQVKQTCLGIESCSGKFVAPMILELSGRSPQEMKGLEFFRVALGRHKFQQIAAFSEKLLQDN